MELEYDPVQNAMFDLLENGAGTRWLTFAHLPCTVLAQCHLSFHIVYTKLPNMYHSIIGINNDTMVSFYTSFAAVKCVLP